MWGHSTFVEGATTRVGVHSMFLTDKGIRRCKIFYKATGVITIDQGFSNWVWVKSSRSPRGRTNDSQMFAASETAPTPHSSLKKSVSRRIPSTDKRRRWNKLKRRHGPWAKPVAQLEVGLVQGPDGADTSLGKPHQLLRSLSWLLLGRTVLWKAAGVRWELSMALKKRTTKLR